MRKTPLLSWAAVLSLAAALPGVAQVPKPLTVVELFTSQGCSSCPPANANLARLADRPDVLALSFGVTYWDQLGWKDTFASKSYTDRQWAYAKGLKHGQVWTPQVVINGRADVVGTNLVEIENGARKAPIGPSGPQVSVSGGLLTIGATGRAAKADVWLVRYDPAIVQVPIKRGENTGKTLPHRNVVRELTRLGSYSGPAQTYRLPPGTAANLRTAILVQAGPGGPILAAAKT